DPFFAAAGADARAGGHGGQDLRRGADRSRASLTVPAFGATVQCQAPGASGRFGSCRRVPRMSRSRVTFGKTGEDFAGRELKRRGYEILARRWRQRGGEIDIVARDGGTLVFVEVKARDGRAFGAAAEAVAGWKQRRIVQLGLEYIARHRLFDCPCRFDV